MSCRYLVDKSALARMPLAPVRRRLQPLIETGRVATCSMIELEVLYSTRGGVEHETTRQRRGLAIDCIPMSEQIFQRAIEIQGVLACSGSHRLPIPDLLIAAAAESAECTVLHYDRDFDRIAEVTGQPVEWVAERGSLC